MGITANECIFPWGDSRPLGLLARHTLTIVLWPPVHTNEVIAGPLALPVAYGVPKAGRHFTFATPDRSALRVRTSRLQTGLAIPGR